MGIYSLNSWTVKSIGVLKSSSGNALVNTLIGVGIGSIVLMTVLDMSQITSKIQSNMRTTLDQSVLIDDIRTSLKNSALCMTRLGSVQSTLTTSAKNLNMKLSTGETLSGSSTDLKNYSLKNVAILVRSSDIVFDDATTHAKTLVLDLELQSTKVSGEKNKNRPLGSLYVMTNASGAITNCSFDDISKLVECPAGQVLISSGPGTLPTCDKVENVAMKACKADEVLVGSATGSVCKSVKTLIGQQCSSGQVLVADTTGGSKCMSAKDFIAGSCSTNQIMTFDSAGKPSCSTINDMVAKACPGSNKIMVSNGSGGTSCLNYSPSAVATPVPVVTAAATPVAAPPVTATSTPVPAAAVTCSGGSDTWTSIDGSQQCHATWSTANVGQNGIVTYSDGPLTLAGQCTLMNGKGVWNWQVKCGGSSGDCIGGGYVFKSASGKTTCTWNYPQTKNQGQVGPLYYTGPSGEKGTLIGTCQNGNWSYSVNCSDAGAAVPTCPTGNETSGKCTYSYPYATDGQYKSVNDQQGYGTSLSATCKSGAWTNITQYDPKGLCKIVAATPTPAPAASCKGDPAYKVGSCKFYILDTPSGSPAGSLDMNGSGSYISGQCVNGGWTNTVISPNKCN